jgi:hypothetical protein
MAFEEPEVGVDIELGHHFALAASPPFSEMR